VQSMSFHHHRHRHPVLLHRKAEVACRLLERCQDGGRCPDS
jgi:hypothetical protein